jgi:hypothetical protein
MLSYCHDLLMCAILSTCTTACASRVIWNEQFYTRCSETDNIEIDNMQPHSSKQHQNKPHTCIHSAVVVSQGTSLSQTAAAVQSKQLLAECSCKTHTACIHHYCYYCCLKGSVSSYSHSIVAGGLLLMS